MPLAEVDDADCLKDGLRTLFLSSLTLQCAKWQATEQADGKSENRFTVMNKSWLTIYRSKSGTALIEFALILPVFVLLLAGIIEFASVYFVKHNMLNAARQAARGMVVDGLPGSGTSITCVSATAGSAEEEACDRLIGFGQSFSVNATEPDPSDPNDTDVSVVITVPAADASPIDVLGLFGSKVLQVTVTMRTEDA